MASAYSRLLLRFPLSTKMITSAAVAGAGDLTCQFAVERKTAWDARRTANMVVLGGVLVAPTLHVWYNKLNATFPGVHLKAVLTRVAADQFVFAPIFIGVFFSAMAIVQNDTASIPRRLRDGWADAVATNWTLWIPAQALNFRFIPIHFQVLFSNGVGVLWNAFLSHATSKK